MLHNSKIICVLGLNKQLNIIISDYNALPFQINSQLKLNQIGIALWNNLYVKKYIQDAKNGIFLELVLSNRNVIRATYKILNFLVAMF